MRMQEVALSMKRYLGMVRLLKPITPSIFAPRFSFITCLLQLASYPGYLAKTREDLKEAARARDSAEAGLTGA